MKTKIKNSKQLNILGNDKSLSNREILTASLKSWWQTLGYFSMFTALPAILTSFAQEAQAEETKKPEVSVSGQTARLVEKLNKSCNKPRLLRSQSNYRFPHQKGEYDIISEFTGGDNCPGNSIPSGTYTVATPYTDSGNTTGANDTVSDHNCFSNNYGYFDSGGPDNIYSFVLTARGANPQIQITTTSSSYNSEIYILNGFTGENCPVGTGRVVNNCLIARDHSGLGGTETIDSAQMNALPLNVPLYLFVDSGHYIGPTSSGYYTLRIQDVSIAPAPSPSRFDFDGDSRADLSVFRPSNRTWYLNRSTQGFSATQFGLSTDKITPADFDGDGKTEIAVFREGTWYWVNSSFGVSNIFRFGLPDDIPVPANYTGDAHDELAIYRGGTWWMFDLGLQQVSTIQFGLPTDKPVPSDYDGDGRADQAVYRNGEWHLNRSSQGYRVIQWGLPTDKPVPADYDGDGKTDPAVYRDGTWYILQSSNGATAFQFGIASDIPAPADYDGDGRTNAAVFRDGVWYLRQSTGEISVQQFGLPNDKPVPAAFLP